MQQPKPESADAARDELEQIGTWLAQYETMQANHANIEKRQAYLEGFLAQPSGMTPLPTSDAASNGTGEVAETADLA